jgi:hypothetical protein
VSDRLRIALLIVAASLALWVGATQTNPAVRWASVGGQVAVTRLRLLRVINAALSAAQEIEIGASVGAQASAQVAWNP